MHNKESLYIVGCRSCLLFIILQPRAVSSVGLEHHVDNVRVAGSNPAQLTGRLPADFRRFTRRYRRNICVNLRYSIRAIWGKPSKNLDITPIGFQTLSGLCFTDTPASRLAPVFRRITGVYIIQPDCVRFQRQINLFSPQLAAEKNHSLMLEYPRPGYAQF